MKSHRLFFVALGVVSLALVVWLAGRNPSPSSSIESESSPMSGNQAHAAAAAGTPSDAPVGATTSAVVSKLQQVRSIPPSALVTNLSPSDEAALLVAYRGAPLSNRTALVWTLAGIGGEETAKAFIHTLREEFAGKKLVADEGGSTGSEEAVMEAIVSALGLLASKSATANDFLNQATSPEFWERTAKWESSTGRERNGLLTSSAIQGMGMADRQDIAERLRSLKDNLPNDTTVPAHLRRSFAGDVVQAAYYADLRDQLGNGPFFVWFLDQERDVFDSDGSYRKWTSTGRGAEWKQWYLNQAK